MINQSINKSINQLMNRSINRSINQSVNINQSDRAPNPPFPHNSGADGGAGSGRAAAGAAERGGHVDPAAQEDEGATGGAHQVSLVDVM
jgi:hypothetical protein